MFIHPEISRELARDRQISLRLLRADERRVHGVCPSLPVGEA